MKTYILEAELEGEREREEEAHAGDFDKREAMIIIIIDT